MGIQQTALNQHSSLACDSVNSLSIDSHSSKDLASTNDELIDEITLLAGQINAAKVDNEWQALARDAYMEDLEWQQRTLATAALKHICEKRDMIACLRRWETQKKPLVDRWREMLTELHATDSPDFAMYAVANRELLDLARG